VCCSNRFRDWFSPNNFKRSPFLVRQDVRGMHMIMHMIRLSSSAQGGVFYVTDSPQLSDASDAFNASCARLTP
jgi:hypothetical protein